MIDQATIRMMLPMLKADLVECTPEANRRHAAEHERDAQALAEHELSAGERVPGVIRRFATWVEAYLSGVCRHRHSSEAVSRR